VIAASRLTAGRLRAAGGAIGAPAAAILVAACAAAPTVEDTPAFRIEPLSFSGAPGSAQMRLAVQDDRAYLSFIESSPERDSAQFLLVERTPSASSPFGPPQTIVGGTNLVVNAADVPSILPLSTGTIVAQWLQTHGDDPEAYDLRLATSSDGGRTWGPPSTPYRDTSESQHGFASMFETPGGGFGLVWLDGRSGDEMALRSTSFSANGAQSEDVAIDPRVCECCQTAVAVAGGSPIAVFRDRSADEIRDIAIARLESGGWSSPTAVHPDHWKIEGCPVNGPAVSASGQDVVVSWFSQNHVFVSFSTDAGRTFGPAIRVDDAEAQGRVQVERLGDGSAAVSWVDFPSGRSQFRVRRVLPSGKRGPAATIAEGMGTEYPRMVRRGGELLFAWAENADGTTRVRTARAPL
jgi:hypothetical protein